MTNVIEEQLDQNELYKLPNFEEQIALTDQDSQNIIENIKEQDMEPSLFEFFPGSRFIPGTKEYEYFKQRKELADKKFDNKLAYMGSLIDETIVNEGFKGSDFLLKRDITMSRSFNNRRTKFMEAYPDGDYKMIQVPINKNKTEYVEVFRYPGEENYRLSNPRGRDVGEFGLVAGYMDPMVIGPEILAAYLTRGRSLLTRTGAVTFASRTGLELRDLTEFIKGYGEREYAEKEDIKFDFFNDVVFDGAQFFEAAFAGGMFGLFEAGGKLITGQFKPGLIKDANALALAAEKLGVEPLTIAQLALNPTLRKTFFQAKEFSKRPEQVQRRQMEAVIKKLNEFGGGRVLTLDELIHLNHTVKQNMEKAFDLFPKSGVAAAQAEEILPQLLSLYNKNSAKVTTSLINKTKNKINKNNPAFVNFTNLKGDVTDILTSIKDAYVPGKNYKVKLKNGSFKTLKGKNVPFNKAVSKPAMNLIDQLNKIKASVGSNTDAGMTKTINSLVNMRQAANKLKESTDPLDQLIGDTILSNVKKIMNPNNDLFSGSIEAKSLLAMLGKHLDNTDIVLNNNKIRNIMAGKGDVSDFMAAAFNPDGGVNASTIKAMLNSSGDISPALSNQMFEAVQKMFVNKLLKDPGNIQDTIAKWQKADPESLASYLGANPEQKILDLFQIQRTYNALDNSTFSEIISKGLTNADLVFDVLRQAKPGKGGKAIDDLIAQGGDGYKESVRNGIIQQILSKSTKTAGEGAEGQVLNAKQLVKELENLKSNEQLMKFFDKAEDIDTLDNFVRYVSRLASGEDVGGAMAGGAQRGKLAESIFNPATLVDVAVTTVRYDVLAALLSKGVKASELQQILDLGSSTSFAAVNVAINNLAKSYNIDIDTEYQYEENLSEDEMRNIKPSSMGSSDIGDKPQFPPSQTIRPDETAAASQIPVELLNQVANNSTLSQANVINPNTMAAGQSVFGQDDPIFSGIMQTNVGRQRVA
tara:strand:- start:4796 stop:7732 length:2937 start_codon:yes stop_codon:yes gene_type:complete